MSDNSPEAFSIPIRVYIEDTDAGGIVFYANYLKFFERARTEFVRSIGLELRRAMSQNCNYVVHSLEVKYHASAKLDDELIVFAKLKKLRKTAMIFEQWVCLKGSDEKLASAEVTVASVDTDTAKPKALDAALYNELSALI